MRFLAIVLFILPVVFCELEPDNTPRPGLRGWSTIRGVCDTSSGTIAGETLSGQAGTLKACTKRCADLSSCKGLNFFTDQNKCVLFQRECDQTRSVARTDPTQNFYLKGEIACSTSTVGDEFFVAFMANRVAQPVNKSLEIWLTQDRSVTDTIVTVEFDSSQTLGGTSQPRKIRVPYKQAVSTLIPFTWKVSDVDNGVTIEKKALKLSSDTDFVLYGVNKEYFTADAFLGIPSRALGTRYVANCHWPPTYNCEFAITPVDPDTTVTITLPRASSTKNFGNWSKPPTAEDLAVRCAIPYKGKTYTNGDTFKITLQLYEVAQIQDPCDLTGTIIEADKHIAVWSGDSRVNVGDSPSRDHQVEELFSTDTWGTDCAAWPTPRRAPGLTDYWVITAASDNTRVRIDSSEKATSYQTLNSGDSVRFPANSVNEWQRFSTDGGKKIQVVQYTHSAVDNTIPGDPSMTICIPSDQFGFGYTFVTPTGVATSYTNYLTIITNEGSQNGFILDGQPVTGVTWQKVPNSNLVGGFVELDRSKQQFRIEHKIKGTTFEAYIYGSGDRESIAYPTGACIKALGECQTSTMFIADGKDNDCDGVIDEELFDGIDNDLDGKIDEDCYARREIQDRCPKVRNAQACYGQQLQLACESGETINVIDAHFGRLNRAGEMTCNSENSADICSGSSTNCGYNDISGVLETTCNGLDQCTQTVTYTSLGNVFAPSSCPTCTLYAQVQYACLNPREQIAGAMTGDGYKASSWYSVSAGSCSGSSSSSAIASYTSSTCGACSSGVASSSTDNYQAANADFEVNSRLGWRPSNCDKDNAWLQVDLGGHYSVGWYAIQGCRKEDSWVTTFGISYSSDGQKWTDIRDPSGGFRSFDGNMDSINVKICTIFGQNIVARYVRIYPLSYKSAPCAHVDFGHNSTLQGCRTQAVVNSNFAQGGTAGFGGLANVTCNRGWSTARGETNYQVQCNSNGQWAGTFRDCITILSCPDVNGIEGGYTSFSNTLVGSTVNFFCLTGRRLRGASSLTCQDNGQWSGSVPTCEQL